MGVRSVTVVALLMLSVGCTDSGQENLVAPSAQPTRTFVPAAPSPTPTPASSTPPRTPAATPLTVKQAAKVYLAAVRPRNAALATFDTNWKASAPIETLRADAARMAAAERHFLATLDNNRWPPSVAENVDNLANCTASSISWYDATTRAEDSGKILPLPPCGGGDAQLIRIRLQLPSN